ncbi:MAG: glycoside hydrolase domain-containing protein, partial [Gemmatimonadales bacterium]
AVVAVDRAADAVRAHLPWRRQDESPQTKQIIVTDTAGNRILNAVPLSVDRESGDIVFQPVAGPGRYFIYYLPYTGTFRSPYPKITWRVPVPTADSVWLRRNRLPPPAGTKPAGMPAARLVAFEAVDAFNSRYPMEVIATAAEIRALLARHPDAGYLVFPEDRSRPIRMRRDLPERWIAAGATGPVAGQALRGEFYAFQLGVWAARRRLSDVRVGFDGLSGPEGGRLPPESFRCFNQGGVNWLGRDFTIRVNVDSGRVQAFWCGVQIPETATPGRWTGRLTVTAAGEAAIPVGVRLTVMPDTIRHAGDDDPYRLSRLRWLDSRLAEDDGVIPPYTPLEQRGDTLGVLGRRVVLGRDGLPVSIGSRFRIEMTSLGDSVREVLRGPVALIVEDSAGRPLAWTGSTVRYVKRAEGAVAWEAENHAGPLEMALQAQLEFDGNMEFRVAIRARERVTLRDIRLEIPLSRDVARYAMGLGLKGGSAPERFDWTWDVTHNQDGAWIGDVNAGLQFSLKDDRYRRPLNTNFYLSQPLIMPASWDNGGQGGCRFRERDSTTYLVTCYSGPRTMAAGETQHYGFRLLLTPFHPIDPVAQWHTRFFHAFEPLDSIAATGANTINVHHATAINPYINYPFLRADAMRAYIDSAHARGMKVKIYYTVRELTNHAPELFALRSLDHEVIADGPGGGSAWLQEHLVDHYISGWHVPELKDAAVINTGISRWHNFYVEGLHWLVENVGIDGLYLDDVAFDRATMKRVRKVLLRGRPGALIDLHSANQFNPRDGFANSANLYLEHFPFIDRLWFGEYFDYGSPPEFWMTEISGIPFGLMGEMLQDGGNPWRGMVYGMTNRLPWAGDPRPLWRLWDWFGMEHARMIGYWVPASPVKTGRSDVLATVYQTDRRALVALASWAPASVPVPLLVDWKALGIDPARARISAPAIPGMQEAAGFRPGQPIPVEPGKGWLLVLEQGP